MLPLDSTFLPRLKKAIRVKMQRTYWLFEEGSACGRDTYIHIIDYNCIYIEVDHEIAS